MYNYLPTWDGECLRLTIPHPAAEGKAVVLRKVDVGRYSLETEGWEGYGVTTYYGSGPTAFRYAEALIGRLWDSVQPEH